MSTSDTIEVMRRLAAEDAQAPTVRLFAENVAALAHSRAASVGNLARPIDLAAALEDEIRDRIQYLPDPVTHERVRSPEYLLTVEPAGDCDDMITLALAVSRLLGIPGKLLRLGAEPVVDPADPFSHVVLLIPAHVAQTSSDLIIDPTVEPSSLPAVLDSLPVRLLDHGGA